MAPEEAAIAHTHMELLTKERHNHSHGRHIEKAHMRNAPTSLKKNTHKHLRNTHLHIDVDSTTQRLTEKKYVKLGRWSWRKTHPGK